MKERFKPYFLKFLKDIKVGQDLFVFVKNKAFFRK